MLRDAAIEEIKRGLGFRKGAGLDATIQEALEATQRELEGANTLPWFLLQQDQTVSLVKGTQSYALPTGFLRVEDDFNVTSLEDGSSNKSVGPGFLPYDECLDLYGFTEEAKPEAVAIRQSNLWFFPIPDAAYTFTWHYYKKDAVLTSNVENEWLKNVPDLIINMAGLRAATRARDPDSAAIFKAEAERWRSWLATEITARREAHVRYVVGRYA